MAKYLDSKGLSYLWQKIKAELATKEGVHEHPYVKEDTVIKLGSTDTTGISLVKGTEGAKDSWTIPFAGVDPAGLVNNTGLVKGLTPEETGKLDVADGKNNWHIAPVIDGYVYYQNNLASEDTVTAHESKNLTDNYVILGAGDKKVKASAYKLGAESYGAPAAFGGANFLATEAAVKEYVDELGSTVSSNYIHATIAEDEKILDIAYADTKEKQPILKTTLGINYDATAQQIQLLGKNDEVIDYISAAEFVKDGMIESVQILKRGLSEVDGSITWTTIDGTEVVSEVINAPAEAKAGTIWLYFVWNTDVDADGTKEGVQRKVSWLPATDLIKDCSADITKGIGAVTNKDGGHEFYVKTTGIEEGKTANVSTGFDKDGNVVGYVDVESYFEAFSQKDLDDIFAAAEVLYNTDPEGPKFPTA